jgi:hypothetical protein
LDRSYYFFFWRRLGSLGQIPAIYNVVHSIQKHIYRRSQIEWECPMPRHARLDVPGTLHHVMVRGIEGSDIFQDEEDRQAFVERIRFLVRETSTRILAWALMDNHAHLLLIG